LNKKGIKGSRNKIRKTLKRTRKSANWAMKLRLGTKNGQKQKKITAKPGNRTAIAHRGSEKKKKRIKHLTPKE